MESRVQASAGLLASPPEKVCLLRLSAIGDCCHVVPLLRTLQDAWPRTRFSWVIGKVEAKLMSLIPEVELITVDKGAGLAAYGRLRSEMKRRGGFDLLLHLQLSIRASVAAAVVPAPLKLGFDTARARELQWLFTNARVAPRQREHVLDSFLGFAETLGVPRRKPRWDIPLPATAHEYAVHQVPDAQPTLLISACSSHALRNWPAQRYAAVAGHVQIHDHEIRIQALRELERLLTRRCLADDLDLGSSLENRAKSGPDEHVVVDEQYSQSALSGLSNLAALLRGGVVRVLTYGVQHRRMGEF